MFSQNASVTDRSQYIEVKDVLTEVVDKYPNSIVIEIVNSCSTTTTSSRTFYDGQQLFDTTHLVSYIP
jgi:hypothetical protein